MAEPAAEHFLIITQQFECPFRPHALFANTRRHCLDAKQVPVKCREVPFPEASLCAAPVARPTAGPSTRRTPTRRAATTIRSNAAAAPPATVVGTNPQAGHSLTNVSGEAMLVPWWPADQIVVVAFLRHFG